MYIKEETISKPLNTLELLATVVLTDEINVSKSIQLIGRIVPVFSSGVH